MAKTDFKPGTMIYPLPAPMITCGTIEKKDANIITIAWTGTICTDPPICYISVRPERHSHQLITKYKEFVINLTTQDLAYATDWCGVRSGRDYNKFKEMNLTPGKSKIVQCPIIEESPLCIECQVIEVKSFGTHDMFIAKVVNVQADEKYMNSENGKFELEKSGLLVFSHGGYFRCGEEIDTFGWSVRKKKAVKK